MRIVLLTLSLGLAACLSSPISQYCASLATCSMDDCELSAEACEELRQGEQDACEAELKATRDVIATGNSTECAECVDAMDHYYQCAADIPTCFDFANAQTEDCDGEYQEYMEACTPQVQETCGRESTLDTSAPDIIPTGTSGTATTGTSGTTTTTGTTTGTSGTTTHPGGTETTDTSSSDNVWRPSYFTVYNWQACIDGETEEASGFSVDGTDYDILITMLVMDESQENNCFVNISAPGPVPMVNSSWTDNFWAAFELRPGTFEVESDCDDVLGGSWVDIEDTLSAEKWGFGVKPLSRDAEDAASGIYGADWDSYYEPLMVGSGWYLSQFDLVSEDAYAMAFEAEVDDGCAGVTGADGYMVEMLNIDIEKPTGGVNTGIYIQDFPLYMYSGAEALPDGSGWVTTTPTGTTSTGTTTTTGSSWNYDYYDYYDYYDHGGTTTTSTTETSSWTGTGTTTTSWGAWTYYEYYEYGTTTGTTTGGTDTGYW